MSRNPYLASSRPSSSYTRSSRSSKLNDYSSIRVGGLLGRSRSSATLAGGSSLSNSYGSSYVPSSSWQRSSSSTRLNRLANDPPKTTTESSSSKSNQDTPLSRSSSRDSSKSSLYKSTTSSYNESGENQPNKENLEDDNDSSHLKNYQDSKLQQPSPVTRASSSSLRSLDSDSSTDYSKRSTTTNLDSSAADLSYDEPIGDSIPSGSARHLKQGQLLKSHSLEINRQNAPQDSSQQVLSSSMSVDRLLLRADSMGERDLRKSFKDLVMENEKLKNLERLRQQEWIRKERQLQRKISELEEENKQIDQWKQEIQRLKDENSSLIRVVSKLSKQH